LPFANSRESAASGDDLEHGVDGCGRQRIRCAAMRARRDELGDRAAFCVDCGWGRRFLGGDAGSLPSDCPDCGGVVLACCPDCGHDIWSMMAVTCAGCGRPLREAELFGGPIRRKPERHAQAGLECAGEVAASLAEPA
jgi:hypothetical protein